MKHHYGAFQELRPNRVILGRTLFLMIVCGIVAFIVLITKLYTIQILQHEKLESMALDQQMIDTKISAFRGTILDRNGKELAVSTTAYSVYISPYELKYFSENSELVSKTLSEILEMPYEKIIEKTQDTSSWYKTIATKIDIETADKIRVAISGNKFKSIHIENDTKRWYPYGSLACHVIGFVGTDGTGLEGIEAKYNKYLTGTDGSVSRLAAANGTEMLSGTYEAYNDPENGSNVILTIDVNVQKIVEKCVRQAIEDYDVENGGCAVVMNVKTSGILALASFENYDLNDYRSVGNKAAEELALITDKEQYDARLREMQLAQWRNMALSDTYEPGSVFKTITLSIGLDSGAVKQADSFFCGGSMSVLGRNKKLNCWRHSGHGSQTLAEAVQHSCNVAFVNIGLKIGAKTFYQYVEKFGLFEKTGIDLLGEAGSQWWPESVFCSETNLSQLAAASFGQTFNITPIQLITAISAAVNGGVKNEPYVVEKIKTPLNQTVYQHEAGETKQVISGETAQVVRNILESVVGTKAGTGKNAAVAGYRIGGKTGTSEKTGEVTIDGRKSYIVSFCGVAPMEDPEIAVLVLLDTPSHETGLYISGGNMAAPTVGNIFAGILPYLGYKKVYTEDELAIIDVEVPLVLGMDAISAEKALKEIGLNCVVKGSGETVVTQIPYGKASVSSGSTVILYMENEDDAGSTAVVPDISGMTFQQAQSALLDAGLYMKTLDMYAGNDEAMAIKQSAMAYSEISEGSIIEVSFVENVDEGAE